MGGLLTVFACANALVPLAGNAGLTVPAAAVPGVAGAVVAGPGGAVIGYLTPISPMLRGSPLTFVNLDEIAHTVTSVAQGLGGRPLFNGNALPGSTATVDGADQVAPGSYAFYCQFHPNMTGTLIVQGSGSGTKPATPTFDAPLRLPPVLTGPNITIPVEKASVQVMPSGPPTVMWTYGGTYPGPTIRATTGQTINVTFANNLPATLGAITVHLHGDHHEAANDGQPDSQLIQSGAQRTYTYPLTNGGRPEPASFNFYHDHRMGLTGRNIWNGLQGMFITDDAAEQALPLPTGAYDVPLLVGDRTFDGANQLTEPFAHPGAPSSPTDPFLGPFAAPGDTTVGDRILVDGVYAPHLDVATHRYRLRLLNGANFQSYDFHLSNGRPFIQIGTGNGLLPKPVVRSDILLGPAQRADVIVDFTGDFGKNVVLESIKRSDRSIGGIGSPALPVMQFRVNSRVTDDTRIPAQLTTLPAFTTPKVPSNVFIFGLGADLNGTYWTVNGRAYDPTRIEASIPLGATQTWLLVNLSPMTHYIHLHEEAWRTVAVDGRAPPPELAGFEDTWRLDPGHSVEVATTFTDYTGVFMIHCHMLDHEDHGMMAQFAVVAPGAAAVPAGYHMGGRVAPAASHSMRPAAGQTTRPTFYCKRREFV